MNMEQTNQNQEVPVPVIVKSTTNSQGRGRPRVEVQWPSESFTFNKLTDSNGMLSTSSLRKKMRAELVKGGLVKVGTLKSAFGRPQNIYQKSA
jgi:hypothetical protein